MATRTELEAQLRTVEAQIADADKKLEEATDLATRAGLSARLSMPEGRAQNIRERIALMPLPAAATAVKKKALAKKKAKAKKKAAAGRPVGSSPGRICFDGM